MQAGYATLVWALEPIKALLEHPDTTEITFEEPHVCGVERMGTWYFHDVPEMDRDRLHAIAILAAHVTGKSITASSESAASVLPGGERIKMLVPPAVPEGTVGLCIRRRALSFTPTLEWLADGGYFEELNPAIDWVSWWREVARGDDPRRRVVVFSGGIAESKTTASEAVLRAIPEFLRLVTVEGSPEWLFKRRNWQRLFFNEAEPASATRRIQDAMQLAAKSLWLQESRGAEAWALLRALKTGVSGGTTIHAPSAIGAFGSIESMIRQSGYDEPDLHRTLRQYIHVVAHCRRYLPRNDGERSRYRMTEVLEVGATAEEDRCP